MILLASFALVILGLYFYYLRLVRRKNQALEALAGIDVQLAMRADSIPNVLKIARRFLEHEQKLFAEITALRASAAAAYDPRNAAQVRGHLEAASELDGKVRQLVATMENYPELRSNELMLQAQRSYSEVEAHVAAARRFYNSAVSDLNNVVEVFPGNMIASLAGISALPFYKAPQGVRAPVDADAYLR